MNFKTKGLFAAILAIVVVVAFYAGRETGEPNKDISAVGADVSAEDREAYTDSGGAKSRAAQSSSDPEVLLAQILGISDLMEREEKLTDFYAQWAANDLRSAAESAAGLESYDDKRKALEGVIAVWVDEDPESCLEWVGVTLEEPIREYGLAEVAEIWGDKAPVDAMTKYLNLPAEDGTDMGLQVIATYWGADHPDEAIDFFVANPGLPRRDQFFETALVSLTNVDPDRVWTEADRFTNPQQVEHVKSMALEAMAEENPQKALELAKQAGSSPVLIGASVRGWSYTDPEAARAWVEKMPDGELKDQMRTQVAD